MIDIDYRYAALALLVSYGIFRAASWVLATAIKLVFLAAFITLGILAMSSSVGLL